MKSRNSSRALAIDILCRWEATGLPLAGIMEEELHGALLADPRDSHLVLALVHGVVRNRSYLDHILAQFSRHPLAAMKPLTRQALRLGLCQLLVLDRIPASAAVNETVKVLKERGQPKWLSGFVNGVLRQISRQPEVITEARGNLPPSVRFSHPPWLVQRWQGRYGRDRAEAMCRVNNTPPPLWLRVNTCRITVPAFVELLGCAEIKAATGLGLEAVRLDDDFRGAISDLPGYREGFFQVQDEAAQLVAYLLGPLAPEERYLDGCAGLGGKTTHLAQMLPPESRLVAVDPHPGRLKLLAENLRRLGVAPQVSLVNASLEEFQPDANDHFHRILIDAPCSGLGVIRRQPDIRWNRQEKDLQRLAAGQLGLLSRAAELLRPGGLLLYAVCSMEPEENEAVIEEFLSCHPGFSLDSCQPFLPVEAGALLDARGFFRSFPDLGERDGFFAARLVKGN